MKKQYTLEQLTYGFCLNSRKWEFTQNGFTYLAKCDGKDHAHKVAGVINGGLKRTKGQGIDGMARKNLTNMGV